MSSRTAVEHAREDVAADVVGAHEVSPRRCLQRVQDVDLVGRVGRDQRRQEGGSHDDHKKCRATTEEMSAERQTSLTTEAASPQRGAVWTVAIAQPNRTRGSSIGVDEVGDEADRHDCDAGHEASGP